MGRPLGRCVHPRQMAKGGGARRDAVRKRSLGNCGPRMSGELVLARMDNSAAVFFANYGAGRVPQLAMMARGIKDLEATLRRTAVALRITGRGNPAADASSRLSVRARGQDPHPGRELRARLRTDVGGRCGPIDVGMLSGDDGPNARGPRYRSPADSAFEGPLAGGQLWRPPRTDPIELVIFFGFFALL